MVLLLVVILCVGHGKETKNISIVNRTGKEENTVFKLIYVTLFQSLSIG